MTAARLWFVMPVHGREAVTAVCLRQLRRTCEEMADLGIDASAVIVGDDSSVDVADCLGFATVRRDNAQLGRKFNDGYQLACDPSYNPRPVDYVVPIGSDDWIDANVFRLLPPQDSIGIFTQMAVVNETRTQLAKLRVLGFAAGVGPRIIHASLIRKANYRPADDWRPRGIDGSTWRGLYRALGGIKPQTVNLDVHPLQLIDWKSSSVQLNTYSDLRGFHRSEDAIDWDEIAEHYPAEAVDEMRALDLVPA